MEDSRIWKHEAANAYLLYLRNHSKHDWNHLAEMTGVSEKRLQNLIFLFEELEEEEIKAVQRVFYDVVNNEVIGSKE
jgi:hypothetical protein